MDDMQRRIAARRAEIERERAEADARVRAAAAAAQAEKNRREEERVAAAFPGLTAAELATKKAAAERTIQDAAYKKWTGAEWTVVGFFGVVGLLLLNDHPVWGVIFLLLGCFAFAAYAKEHREKAERENPNPFSPTAEPTNPPASSD